MRKSRSIRLLSLCALAAAWLFAAGCGWLGESKTRMPSEDIEVLTAFAPEIAVLQDKSLARNSKEKYEAAMRLNDGVDFSYTRNVRTLDNIFGARDANVMVMSTTMQYVIFRYEYGGNAINFNFARSGNTVINAEVVISKQ